MIFCKIVSFGVALYAIERMQMWPISLLMFWISTINISPAGLFTYDSTGFISKSFPILLAIIVRALSFLNRSWRFGNWTFTVCVSIASTPWVLESKFETYLKKKKFMPLHSTEVIFWVALASSFENKVSKISWVYKVTERKKVNMWSFKQSFRTLIVGLLLMVRPMSILRAFLVAPSCITVTMSSRKSASSFRSLSIGDGPWGPSPEREVSLDSLLRGVFNGEMVVTCVEAIVLLFCACFKLGAFALVVVRSSWTTWLTTAASKPPNPMPELASAEINFGVRGEGWSWGSILTLGIQFFCATASTTFCAIAGEELEALEVKEHHHHYDRHHSRVELPFQVFRATIVAQSLQKLLSLQAHYSRAGDLSKMNFLLTNRLS